MSLPWSRGGDRRNIAHYFSPSFFRNTNHTFILATCQEVPRKNLYLLGYIANWKRIGHGVHMRSVLNMSSGSNQALHPLGVADCDHMSRDQLTSNSWHLGQHTPETEALFGSLSPSVWAKSEIINGPRFGWQNVLVSVQDVSHKLQYHQSSEMIKKQNDQT